MGLQGDAGGLRLAGAGAGLVPDGLRTRAAVVRHAARDGRRSTPWRREYAWHDNPFKLELLHFGECIRAGQPPITPGREAIADIQLVGDIVRVRVSVDSPSSS